MSEISERYERVTGQFTDRVRGAAPGAWDHPSPCEGWTARDVVGHLTEWIPGFFAPHGVVFPAVPSVQDDPVGAWEAVQAAVGAALADPALASKPIEMPMGTLPFADAVDMIVIADVFVHTWDLARATGQDEVLDPAQLRRMTDGIGTMPEEVLRAEGVYGPAIDAPSGADEQTKLLAYLGRRSWLG